MKAMWPVRVEGDIKQAFEKAAADQGVDVSSLRRAAYDEFIANHPDFFADGACECSQIENIAAQEVPA